MAFRKFRNLVTGRTRRDAKLLIKSGLFDLTFYARQLSAHETPSVDHFLKLGWQRGLSPSPFFDTTFYTVTYPDVKQARWNPVMHYIRHGWQEGRRPHPDFDRAKYIADHPKFDFNSSDPLADCIHRYHSFRWTNDFRISRHRLSNSRAGARRRARVV